MRKIIVWVFMGVLVLAMGIGGTLPVLPRTVSAESEMEVELLPSNFASSPETLEKYGIAETNVDDFTPFDDVNSSRMSGNSFSPSLVGAEGNKYIETEFNVSETVKDFDATDLSVVSTGLELWINYDQKPSAITRGIQIELFDATQTNKIKWVLSVDEVRTLTTRTQVGKMDQKIYGSIVSNVPVGWVKLNLPVVTATVEGELATAGKLNISKCKITQDQGVGTDQALSFYSIKLVEIADTKTEKTAQIMNYSAIVTKSTAKVSPLENYYTGELFPKFMSANEVFVACWVGRTNYLSSENIGNLKVATDTGIGETPITYYAFGAGDFKIKHTVYTISYGFMYENRFVGILSERISAEDYGKGVWLEYDSKTIEIGETKKIYYSVHKAFNYATIKFESTDGEILAIKEINDSNNYIVVEALKKGDAGIKIVVTDDRLEGTDYETTGLINEDFTIEVVKAEKKTNTTVIMLWIGLGAISIGVIYLAIKAIIDSKKIEIK